MAMASAICRDDAGAAAALVRGNPMLFEAAMDETLLGRKGVAGVLGGPLHLATQQSALRVLNELLSFATAGDRWVGRGDACMACMTHGGAHKTARVMGPTLPASIGPLTYMHAAQGGCDASEPRVRGGQPRQAGRRGHPVDAGVRGWGPRSGQVRGAPGVGPVARQLHGRREAALPGRDRAVWAKGDLGVAMTSGVGGWTRSYLTYSSL